MRLPWLRARLRLVVLAGWDLVMLLLAYAGIYQLRIGGWWGESGEAWGFALAWLVFSYLLGRYSRESPQRSVALRRLGLALAAAALLLLAVQLNSWLARVLMEATRFRGFLLPWLGLVVLGSLLGQTLLRRRSVVGLPWLLVASPAEQQVLERELAGDRRRWGADGLSWRSCSLSELDAQLKDQELAGVAISTAALGTQRPSELGLLLAARKRGLSCCALDSWCERQLQRLPPELFDPDALLVGEGFQLQPGCFIWRLKRFGDVLGAGPAAVCHRTAAAAGHAADQAGGRRPPALPPTPQWPIRLIDLAHQTAHDGRGR